MACVVASRRAPGQINADQEEALLNCTPLLCLYFLPEGSELCGSVSFAKGRKEELKRKLKNSQVVE
jgi:hypothetical protein